MLSGRAQGPDIGDIPIHPHPLRLSRSELEGRVSEIAEFITLSGIRNDYRSSSFAEKLRDLGSELYESLFDDAVKNVFEAAFAVTEVERPILFEIDSEYAILPWEMLYIEIGDQGGEFVGLSSAVFRRMSVRSPIPAISGDLNIVNALDYTYDVNTGKGIRYTKVFEDKFLHRYRAGLPGRTFTVAPVDGANAERKKLSELSDQYLSTIRGHSPKIIHFACHGDSSGDFSRNSIRVRDGFSLSYRNIERSAVVFDQAPVVFLNACDCDLPRPAAMHTLHRLFYEKKQARAILAPQFQVSDRMSALFALSFYRDFLHRNKALCWAALGARRHIYEHKNGSLVGLLYSAVGQGQAYIKEVKP